MILISGTLWGLISLGTLHIKLSIDLPAFHWQGHLSFLTVDVTTGPMSTAVPAHSVAAVQVVDAPVHSPADPAVSPAGDTWS